MEAAMNLISRIPGDALKIVCMLCLGATFFIPLFFLKKRTQSSAYEMLRDTKIALEIKKLVLEIDEKRPSTQNTPTPELAKRQNHFVEEDNYDFTDDDPNDLIRYYDKIKYSMSGSLFFFLITSMAMSISSNILGSLEVYLAIFIRDLGVSIFSGFVATFIPWGNEWNYYIYGFTLPIMIAIIIVIIT